MIACLATSLNAIFCAVNFGAAAIIIQLPTKVGNWNVHCNACIPPKLPPIIKFHFGILR